MQGRELSAFEKTPRISLSRKLEYEYGHHEAIASFKLFTSLATLLLADIDTKLYRRVYFFVFVDEYYMWSKLETDLT